MSHMTMNDQGLAILPADLGRGDAARRARRLAGALRFAAHVVAVHAVAAAGEAVDWAVPRAKIGLWAKLAYGCADILLRRYEAEFSPSGFGLSGYNGASDPLLVNGGPASRMAPGNDTHRKTRLVRPAPSASWSERQAWDFARRQSTQALAPRLERLLGHLSAVFSDPTGTDQEAGANLEAAANVVTEWARKARLLTEIEEHGRRFQVGHGDLVVTRQESAAFRLDPSLAPPADSALAKVWEAYADRELSRDELAAFVWIAEAVRYLGGAPAFSGRDPENEAPIILIDSRSLAAVGYLRLRQLPVVGAALVQGPWLDLVSVNATEVPFTSEEHFVRAVHRAAELTGLLDEGFAYSWDVVFGYALNNGRDDTHEPIWEDIRGGSAGATAALLMRLQRKGVRFPANWLVSGALLEEVVQGVEWCPVDGTALKAQAILDAPRWIDDTRPMIDRFAVAKSQGIDWQESAERRDRRLEQPAADTLDGLEELVCSETRAASAWADHLESLPSMREGLPAYYLPEPGTLRTRAELFVGQGLLELVEPKKKERGESAKDTRTAETLDGMAAGTLGPGTARSSFDKLVAWLRMKPADGERRQHALLSAAAGHGKSLTAMMIGQRMAKDLRQDAGRAVVPIPITVAAASAASDLAGLIQAAATQAPFPGLPAFNAKHSAVVDDLKRYLQHKIEAGEAAFLLDGLDEAGTARGAKAIGLVRGVAPHCRAVVFTRPYGIVAPVLDALRDSTAPPDEHGNQPLAAECWRLEDLTRAQAEDVMGKYFGGSVPNEATDALNNLKGRLAVLRGSGLLLTFVFHLVSKGRGVGRDTKLAEVYREIIRLVVEDSRRDVEREFETEDLLALLPELSFEPFMLDPRSNVIRRADMLNAIRRENERPGAAERDLKNALKQLCAHGLLYQVPDAHGKADAETAEAFAYVHRSFHEYLAARRLFDVLADPKNAATGLDTKIAVRVIRELDGTPYDPPTSEQPTERADVPIRRLMLERVLLNEACDDMHLSFAELLEVAEREPASQHKAEPTATVLAHTGQLYRDFDRAVHACYFEEAPNYLGGELMRPRIAAGVRFSRTLRTLALTARQFGHFDGGLKGTLLEAAAPYFSTRPRAAEPPVTTDAGTQGPGDDGDGDGVIAWLRDTTVSPYHGHAIACALAPLAVDDPEVRQGLLAGLEKREVEAEVRNWIASALAPLAKESAEIRGDILAALTKLLEDGNPGVRWSAADAVGELGAAAATPEFLAALTKLLEDGDPDVRGNAADAVGELGAAAATSEVLAALAKLLEHGDPDVRQRAADAVGKLGAAAATPEVLAALAKLLEHGDPDVRPRTADAVGGLGEAAATPEFLAALAKLLEHGDPDVRRRAADAVGRLGAAAATPAILAALAKLLEHGDPDVRRSAAYAARGLGAAAATPEFLAALTKLLEDGDPDVRGNAAYAVGSLGAAAATPEFLAALAGLLGDGDQGVRQRAAYAVGSLGAATMTPEFLAALAKLLEDGDPGVRSSAARALGGRGAVAATPEFLVALAKLLEDGARDVRRSAAFAVERLGAAAATPEILAALANEDLYAGIYARGRGELAEALSVSLPGAAGIHRAFRDLLAPDCDIADTLLVGLTQPQSWRRWLGELANEERARAGGFGAAG